jgi:glycosyltransferase involved in cell wall biosynthesis
MKKIMICIPTLASAGAERFATELACNIDRERFEPIIMVTTRLDENSAFYKKLLLKNVKIYDFGNCGYKNKIWKIRNVIRKEKPSIIHTNVGAALHMLLPILLSFTNAKHLFTTHSMGYRIFSGIKKQIMAFCFHAKIVIPVAICDTVKQSLVEAYGLKNKNIECVYNGVDTDLFHPSEIERGESNTVFVSTGTLYHIKNHKLLIDAFSIVHRNNPNTMLRIIGDGELKSDLVDQVKSLNLESAVKFEGNQSDVARYLNISDIYCCTSKVEGLPIAVLEAMACGLPVITTPAGGVVDIVKDGVNGFVVNASNDLLAEKMSLIANDLQLLKKMGKKSRELAMKYNIKECVKGYETLYDKYAEVNQC